ncbi:MAG: MoaD/ThiS family protein [Methanolobus sp.]|nr:MoaD/ThiS family protein [Methanolobus sp.]
MKVEIEYDYLQKKFLGESEILELEDGTTIGNLFRELDKRIEAAAREQGVSPKCAKFLKADGTHACMFHVNKENPLDRLGHVLEDGDRIMIIIGFCGG